jgi:hypothetical protein
MLGLPDASFLPASKREAMTHQGLVLTLRLTEQKRRGLRLQRAGSLPAISA